LGDRTDSINGFLPRNSYIIDVTSQTYGDKVVSQEGNSPKQEYKVPKLLFSVIKEVCLNIFNQGVGLEIAMT
jgi:hypothetical protein